MENRSGKATCKVPPARHSIGVFLFARDGPVGTYKTSDFKKGIKVQIDGEPYLMTEMNFVKPGKGNALYKCKLKNLIRNTVLDRTFKGG